MLIGAGTHRYDMIDDWAQLPQGQEMGEVAAVGVDSGDRVYVFNRGPDPMLVFSRDGSLLSSWGQGIFRRPHGIHVGADDAIYCTDDWDHSVRKCTGTGEVELVIGQPGEPAPAMSGRPFHQCTHSALSPAGEIYVSDGYCNAQVHKFAPDGRHLLSWGEAGCEPGQFNLPHNICCDADGWVYVADRENHRIQVFDGNGRFETQWHGLHRPCGLTMTGGACPLCYVGELGPALGVNRRFPNLGPRITITDLEGRIVARIGNRDCGTDPDQFIAPHGLAVDSHGDLYVGEVSVTSWPVLFPDRPIPTKLSTLRKLTRVASGG